MARGGGSIVGEGLAVYESLKSSLPYLEDEATVVVHGSPKAKRSELYFLAAAVGFSLVRRYDILAGIHPPPAMIMVEYDAASNVVQFTVRVKTNLVSAVAGGGPGAPPPAAQRMPLLSGPPEEVRGEPWTFFTAGLGPAGGDRRLKAPTLRAAGRPILTRNPTCEEPDPAKPAGGNVHSPNPRPCGDARSRGTAYNLLYAALTTPQGAGLKEFPAPTDANKFVGG